MNELKQILKKDFNKRMVENTAFKLFEVWWDEKIKSQSVANTNSTPIKEERIVTLKDSMPKMPSFRVSCNFAFFRAGYEIRKFSLSFLILAQNQGAKSGTSR